MGVHSVDATWPGALAANAFTDAPRRRTLEAMFGTPATATPAQPAHPAASANPITGPSPAAPAAQLGRHDGGRPQTGATSQTEFVTGAYENSGDPTIDRLLQLEQALKRFGRGY